MIIDANTVIIDPLEQCVDNLVALEGISKQDIQRRVDYFVDDFLMGFGSQTSLMRLKLAVSYISRAPMTRDRDLIKAQILREEGDVGDIVMADWRSNYSARDFDPARQPL